MSLWSWSSPVNPKSKLWSLPSLPEKLSVWGVSVSAAETCAAVVPHTEIIILALLALLVLSRLVEWRESWLEARAQELVRERERDRDREPRGRRRF